MAYDDKLFNREPKYRNTSISFLGLNTTWTDVIDILKVVFFGIVGILFVIVSVYSIMTLLNTIFVTGDVVGVIESDPFVFIGIIILPLVVFIAYSITRSSD